MAHTFPITAQLALKGSPGGKAHGKGKPLPAQLVIRQALGLFICHRLQAVLHIPQEQVGFGEFVGHILGQQFQLHQLRQHLDQVRLTQGRQLATTDQLKRLHNKFHFTNATGAQLHIRLHALAVHFPLDQGLHFPQGLEGAVVDIAAINEGIQALDQAITGLQIAGHGAHLDQRITLPFTALSLVVTLHGIKADGQHATLAPGAQAHVHAEDKTVSGGLVQRLDQLLAQAHKELMMGQRTALAFDFTLMLVGKNQVDIGRQVQLVGTQLAHGQHHQPDRVTVRVQRCTTALTGPAVQHRQRLVDEGVRQQRQVRHGTVVIADPGQIPPDNAHHMTMAQTAQGPLEIVLAVALRQQGADLLFQGRRRQRLAQVTGQQPLPQPRIALELGRHVVRARPYTGQVGQQSVGDTVAGFNKVHPVLADQHRQFIRQGVILGFIHGRLLSYGEGKATSTTPDA